MKVLTLPPANSFTGGRKPSVDGSLAGASFGFAKLNTEVRSPATVRRQGEIFGSNTPKRFSMN